MNNIKARIRKSETVNDGLEEEYKLLLKQCRSPRPNTVPSYPDLLASQNQIIIETSKKTNTLALQHYWQDAKAKFQEMLEREQIKFSACLDLDDCEKLTKLFHMPKIYTFDDKTLKNLQKEKEYLTDWHDSNFNFMIFSKEHEEGYLYLLLSKSVVKGKKIISYTFFERQREMNELFSDHFLSLSLGKLFHPYQHCEFEELLKKDLFAEFSKKKVTIGNYAIL